MGKFTLSKILITLTYGIDNQEIDNIFFIFDNIDLEDNNNVQVWLLASSINLCRIGQTEGLVFPPFEPIRHLIDEFISKGGKIYLLEPSSKSQLFDENNFI